MTRLLLPALLCLLATLLSATTATAVTREGQPTTNQRSWRGVDSQATTILRRVETTTQKPRNFRSSPLDLGPPPDTGVADSSRNERRLHALSGAKVGGEASFSGDNSLRDGMLMVSAGEGEETKKKKVDDDEDEDKKTLSQQIADGKYGLIQKEIYSRPSLRPGIISYKANPEVPRDTEKNLGGLEAEEIWLAEDHVLVLRGGWFPNHSFNKTETGPVWPPIDDYNAPPRQVKIPAKPKVPPPFPIQLKEGGPTEFIGPNGTKSQYPFQPPGFFSPQGNFPPGAGFYPPPGNGSLYPPPQYPFPPPRNGSFLPPPGGYPPQGNYPQGNFPPPGDYSPPPGRFPPPPGNYPYPPENGQYPQFPYPPPPHGYMPFPNGSSPFGPLPPFLPPLPPGAAFLPPPGNQTDFDEDDPSIYYPPPYDFFYPRDNATEVPPGPLVPGIILPPPPDFFAPLDENKGRRPQRPTTTPLPHVPYVSYRPDASPSPGPNFIPQGTPPPPHGSYLPGVSPSPQPRPDVAFLDVSTPLPPQVVTQPPSSTPYGAYLPGANRPTVKRPYLAYVPVTTAVRKKKPRPPTTTPQGQFEVTDPVRKPVDFTTTAAPPTYYARPAPLPPAFNSRPRPPHFVSPQHVQVDHKGESPITSRPFYLEIDNVVTSTPDPIYNGDPIDTTQRPDYVPDGLSKLKDILYTTPRPTVTYQLGTVIDIDAGDKTVTKVQEKPQYVTSLKPVKNIESTTVPPNQYYPDLTKRPIYVKDFDDQNGFNKDLTSTAKYPSDYEGNSVGVTPQSHRGRDKIVTTTPASQYFAFQPQRTPKTTYYFYEEPHYEQGYVRDITTSKPFAQSQYDYVRDVTTPKPFAPAQWQYDRRPTRPAQQQQNFNIQRPQSPEEQLLAQIVETFRQPGGYIYNPQTNQNQPPQNPPPQNLPPQNYYNSGGNGQNFYSTSRPNGFNIYSTPRPGFYVSRKPDYYSILQTESPLNYNNYNNYNPQTSLLRDYPYNYEDVVQSTEHPLPQRYSASARPQSALKNSVAPSRLKGPDVNVQTSPKTVYEYSYQKQPDTTNTFIGRPTARPRLQVQPSFHPIQVQRQRHPQQQQQQQQQLHLQQQIQQQQQHQQEQQSTIPLSVRQPHVQPTNAPLPPNSINAQYYEQVTPTVKPKPDKLYRTNTPRPPHHLLPAVQTATPDPLQHFYTQNDATLLDDITKKYFTIFGQKLPAGQTEGKTDRYYDNERPTTPLPDTHTRYSTPQGGGGARYPTQPAQQQVRVNQPGSQNNNYASENTQIPLHDDILVNYLHPRPTINPDSEYVDTNVDQHIDDVNDDDDSKGGELVSYQLPGNGGGHVYFVTPQLAASQERDADNGGYLYQAPARRLRPRRNKTKQT